MLKIFIWFCLLILGYTKPSPDWKDNDAIAALLSSQLNDDYNGKGNDEAPVVETSGLIGDKNGVCFCDKLPLDTDLKKAITKHRKSDKRCGCCCCDCCDDCCCGGGGGGGGCGCGCCDCCDCCHGDDCCCHDCCHGDHCGCCDCCCGCGCCTHDCHCHDHYHQNWVPACCCCCCDPDAAAKAKAKSKKLKEKADANPGVSAENVELASEDAAKADGLNTTEGAGNNTAKADRVNTTEGTGNDTANATKAANDTAEITNSTEHTPANDTANSIKPAENGSGSGEGAADPVSAIKAAIHAIKAQTSLKRRCYCDQEKSKKCDIVKDIRCKKNINRIHVKSHGCCGCQRHCPCLHHHQGCHHHHRHHQQQ